jgi:hypothetical protein
MPIFNPFPRFFRILLTISLSTKLRRRRIIRIGFPSFPAHYFWIFRTF